MTLFSGKEGGGKDKGGNSSGGSGGASGGSGGGSKDSAMAVPRLSVCADLGKVDRARLCQTEVCVTPPHSAIMESRQHTVRQFITFSNSLCYFSLYSFVS